MIASMKKLFGTDGMRGESGEFPLDAASVRAAGGSPARNLAEKLGREPRVVTGRDTRESGEWIERAFVEGARESGALGEAAGGIPTPGGALLVTALPAGAGVVVSASHNPFQDNGIKIFAPDGRKLDDATERQIEADIYAECERRAARDAGAEEKRSGEVVAKVFESNAGINVAGGRVGAGQVVSGSSGSRPSELRARYLDYLAEDVAAGLDLEGLKVVVDCATGAASELAPALLARLGASVVAIGNAPDGRNINLGCGSLHIDALRPRVGGGGGPPGGAQ